MTREQYDEHKRQLDEQLQTGIRLLEAAHQAQVRALDMVWMLQGQVSAVPAAEAAPPSPPERAPTPAPAPSQSQYISSYHLERDLRAALPHLPEQFTRGDVCEVVGYEPDRSTLYRILRELVQEGSIRIEAVGSGRRATIYRKTDV